MGTAVTEGVQKGWYHGWVLRYIFMYIHPHRPQASHAYRGEQGTRALASGFRGGRGGWARPLSLHPA